MNDSTYLINIQVDNTDEIIQVIAMNKHELQLIVMQVATSESLITAVQSLGSVELAQDYLEKNNASEDLNYGSSKG